MGDKGKKDKGKREEQKKGTHKGRGLNYVEKERGEERGERGKFVEGVVRR